MTTSGPPERDAPASVFATSRRASRQASTDPALLAQYLSHEDGHTRVGALTNCSTPIAVRLGALAARGLSASLDIAAAGDAVSETDWMTAHARSEALVRQQLALESADLAVQHALACNPHLDGTIATRLAAHPDWTVRLRLAGTASTPVHLLARLASDTNPRIRALVARTSRTPSAVVQSLLNDANASVRLALSQRPGLDPTAVAHLSQDADLTVRRRIARRPDLPSDVVRALAGDPKALVRRAVGRRSDLPDDLVVALLLDDDLDVARYVVGHRSLNNDQARFVIARAAPTVAAEVFRQHRGQFRIDELTPKVRRTIAGRHWLHPDDATQLMQLNDVEIGRALAGNTGTPSALLVELGRLADVVVRRAVARNPVAPAIVLAELASDDDQLCKRSACTNPCIALCDLESHLDEPFAFVRRAAFEHVDQTDQGRAELAARLGYQLATTPLASAAQNADSDDPTLLRLAVALGESVAVAANTTCPPEVLIEAWDAANAEDGAPSAAPLAYVLAEHHNLPPSLLAQLLASPDRLLRQRIAQRSDLSLATIRSMLAAQDVTATLVANAAARSAELDPPLKLGSRQISTAYLRFIQRAPAPQLQQWRVDTVHHGESGRRIEIWTDLEIDGAPVPVQWVHVGVAFDAGGQIVAMLGVGSRADGGPLALFDGAAARELGRHPVLSNLRVFTNAVLGVIGDGDLRRVSIDNRGVGGYYQAAGSFVAEGVELRALSPGAQGAPRIGRASSTDAQRQVYGYQWTCEDQSRALVFLDHTGDPIALVTGPAPGSAAPVILHERGRSRVFPVAADSSPPTGKQWMEFTLSLAQQLADGTASTVGPDCP